MKLLQLERNTVNHNRVSSHGIDLDRLPAVHHFGGCTGIREVARDHFDIDHDVANHVSRYQSRMEIRFRETCLKPHSQLTSAVRQLRAMHFEIHCGLRIGAKQRFDVLGVVGIELRLNDSRR